MKYDICTGKHIAVTVRAWGKGKTYPRRHESRAHRGGDNRSVFKNLEQFTQVT